ncbi:MAG: ClpXP protease specificity-enhancing factor SspB [Holosporaceae bacterium]|nr:ClpXP protease specificity-enhancing factor SspB [Holosporaceae bacterium]
MDDFRYDELVQKALVSVVKEVLERVSTNGLCGNHHFYIRFRTDHPKVQIPAFLKERHPEEVMIVIQYQFWNLEVSSDGFSVELSFNGVRELLSIPFSSLTAFVDPSVKFALQFTPSFCDNSPPKESPKKSDKDSDTEGNIISFDSFRKK